MKRKDQENFELAFKDAAPASKKVGWTSIFDRVLIPVQNIFSYKAKAFSFCLFYYTPHCQDDMMHRHAEERSDEASRANRYWILRSLASQNDVVRILNNKATRIL